MASKKSRMAKNGNFEYLIEYPIWVSIKKTLTGKLVLDGLNLINCIGFKENIQKLMIFAHFQELTFFGGFWTFFSNWM